MKTKHWIVSVAMVASACSSATTQKPASPATAEPASMTKDVDPAKRPQNPPAVPQKGRDSAAPGLDHGAYYYDGDHKRTLWQSNELVAEFAPSEQSEQAMKRFAPDSEILPSSSAIMRLWRVKGADAGRALRELSGFAPVYFDLDSTAAPKRSLPGDVIVYLDPSWDRARADEWAASQGVTLAKRLPLAGKNAFVIKTAPGKAALDLANRLHESGTVVSATPNWWRDAAVR